MRSMLQFHFLSLIHCGSLMFSSGDLLCCSSQSGAALKQPSQQHATTQRRSRRRAVWLYFQTENDKRATCIICKKGVKYSGNTADLFKHLRNHAEENEELKKRREERNPPPDPDRPRAFQSSNVRVDNSGENNILVIFSIS